MSLKFSSEKKACQNKLLRLLSGHYGNTVIGFFGGHDLFLHLDETDYLLKPNYFTFLQRGGHKAAKIIT